MMLWLDGELRRSDAARVDPADRGFTLGDGVFETILIVGGAPAHLPSHLARMHAGAAVLGIPVPCDDATIAAALGEVLAANRLGEAAARITLSRGPAPRGVLPVGTARPTLLITAGKLPPPPPPARLIIAASTRRNEFSPLSRIKSLNYLDSVLARREAHARGADDALLLNTAGFLAEATAACVFVRLDGAWRTPPVSDGALPGIFRAQALAAGWCGEARISPAELSRAEAVLLGNSLGVREVASLEGRGLELSLPE